MAVAPVGTIPPRRPLTRGAFWGGIGGVVALVAVVVGVMFARERLADTNTAAAGASESAARHRLRSPRRAPAPSSSIVSVSDLLSRGRGGGDRPSNRDAAQPSGRPRGPHGIAIPLEAALPRRSNPANPPPPPAAKPDCDPAFWIDSDGHKRYKPACL